MGSPFVSADPVATSSTAIGTAEAVEGAISGTVTDEGTGLPLPDICVDVYDTSYAWAGWGYTDSSGNYSVEGLAPGDYKVQFWDCSVPSTYVPEWYNDRPDFASADLVPAGSSGIDAALGLALSISGTVTDESTSLPLADICVTVYDTSHAWRGSDITDPTGNYSVGGLAPGDYKVEFQDCSYPPTYLSEWYNDKPDFDSADLVPAGSITDAALALAGSISGTVTDESTSLPLADICVYVYDTSYNWRGYDYTDDSGNYSVGGLTTGDYKVRFEDCLDPEAALVEHPVASQQTSTPMTWELGRLREQEPVLGRMGMPMSERDRLFHEVRRAGADTTCATPAVNGSMLELARGGWPSPSGAFFEAAGAAMYLSEWYDDKPDFECADLVPVTAGSDTSGIDAALSIGGLISGTVTDETTGLPLADICAYVYDTSYNWWGSGQTDALGQYGVGGLPMGDYKVRFRDCSDPATYASEWYNDKADFECADPVPVTVGSDTSGIDAALAIGGSISGTVIDETTGLPLADICVDVYDASNNWLGSDRTDALGQYGVGGLPTGDYKLRFRDCSDPILHAAEWYNDKPDRDSADPVPVTAGSDTSGIDAALAIGGAISGTVTDESTGLPLADICAHVYDTSYNWWGSDYTAGSGQYRVEGLAAGDYKVEFWDCSFPGTATHISEWWDNKLDFESADPVSVTAGSDTSGIDAALAIGGYVSGTVTEETTGAPLSDICVGVIAVSGGSWGVGSTDCMGRYTVGGLPTGEHKVQFWDCSFPGPATNIQEWWDNKPDFDSADPVLVTAGSGTSGIDAALAVGGSISGTVTDEGTGDPLRGICVDVYDPSCPPYPVGSDRTDCLGNYSVGGLPSGGYKVEFQDCTAPLTYATEWWDDKASCGSADVVPVAAGSDTSGVNAGLAPTDMPTPTATAIPTPTDTPVPPSPTPTPLPCTPPFTPVVAGDTDCDGAPDAAELGPDPVLCGSRDPNNPWDFYDVPVPTIKQIGGGDMNNRDSAVTLFNDVLGVLEYSGTIDDGPPNGAGRDYDDDFDGDGIDDGIAYDREVGAPWPELGVGKSHSGPPGGAVTLFDDVLLVLDQSGHGPCPGS